MIFTSPKQWDFNRNGGCQPQTLGISMDFHSGLGAFKRTSETSRQVARSMTHDWKPRSHWKYGETHDPCLETLPPTETSAKPCIMKLRHEMVSQTNTNKHSTIHPRFPDASDSNPHHLLQSLYEKHRRVIGDHHLISSRFNGHCGWTSVWIYLTPPRRLRNKCGTVSSPLTFLLLFFSIYCRKKINMTTYNNKGWWRKTT